MKTVLITALAASIAIYFLSSFLFPALGERMVVPVMIVSILAAVIGAVWLIVLLIRQRKKR